MGKSGNPAKAAALRDSAKPDAFVPIRIDRKGAKARIADAELIPIFVVTEDDDTETTYSVPNAKRAEIALEYLALIDAGDEEKAGHYLLTETMGREAYDALRSIVGLDEDEFNGVVARVRKIVMPKARGPKAPRR